MTPNLNVHSTFSHFCDQPLWQRPEKNSILLPCTHSRRFQRGRFVNLLHRLSRPHLCGANNHPKLKAAAQPLPVAGGLNSMASLNGQNTGAEKSSQNHHSHAEHSRHVSVDPQASGENIVVIHSPQELADILALNHEKLVCLMCKAIGCRPCKVFARKYQRLALAYQECVFLECTGDETIDLRKLMIQMGIRSTPTFRLYHQGECVKTHVGIDDQKLRAALDTCLGRSEEPQEAVDTIEKA